MTDQYLYELSNTQAINSDIIELRLRPQDPKQHVAYQAGQYVLSKVNNISFPLSIANTPRTSHQLIFHLRHNHNQPQAQYFLKQLHKHNTLQLHGPHGQMIIKNMASVDQLVLLAGGTGIAPFKAMLEQLVHNSDPFLNKINLFWGVRKLEDLYIEDWLKQIKTAYPGFTYQAILSDLTTSLGWLGATGWVYEHAVKILKKSARPTRVFASGPYDMVINSQKEFLAAGLEPTHFISDMLLL